MHWLLGGKRSFLFSFSKKERSTKRGWLIFKERVLFYYFHFENPFASDQTDLSLGKLYHRFSWSIFHKMRELDLNSILVLAKASPRGEFHSESKKIESIQNHRMCANLWCQISCQIKTKNCPIFDLIKTDHCSVDGLLVERLIETDPALHSPDRRASSLSVRRIILKEDFIFLNNTLTFII